MKSHIQVGISSLGFYMCEWPHPKIYCRNVGDLQQEEAWWLCPVCAQLAAT